MSDHTPGPWYVRWKDNGFPREVRTGSRGVAAPMWTDANGDPNPDEAAANAQLISAAPHLYEAAKKAEGVLADMKRGEGEDHVLSELHAAIAKAEGPDA